MTIAMTVCTITPNSNAVAIPNSDTTIANNAFHGCAALQTLTFQATVQVTAIPTKAFASTGLTSVAIPSTITSIAADSFTGSNGFTVTVSSPTIAASATAAAGQSFYELLE